jgi:hypothetical protein
MALPWLSRGGSPIVWGEADTPAGFWWLVSGQLYRPNVFGLPVEDWPIRLGQWAREGLLLFTVAGVPLILLGLADGWRRAPRLAAALALALVLVCAYAFWYAPADAYLLLLPAVAVLSIPLASGLRRLGWASLVLPAILLALNWSHHRPMARQPLRQQVEALLGRTPTGALLITQADPTFAALLYFRHVEGARPDVAIVDQGLYQFDWYRERLARQESASLPAAGDIQALVHQSRARRPVCFASLLNANPLNCLPPL